MLEKLKGIVIWVENEKSVVGMHIDTEEDYKNIQESKEGGQTKTSKA